VALTAESGVVNRLIEALPRAVQTRLLNHCDQVDLEFGTIVCEAGLRLPYAYFPLTATISLVTQVGNHAPLELGLIGDEGMLDAAMVLGVDTARLRGIVQGPGTALRVTAAQLRRQLRDGPALRHLLQRYLFVALSQLSQTAACSRFHEIKARLARWLLMTHDRAHGDHFRLTHQYLADMLGVRRSAVTIAAGALQKRKLIQYRRGEIRIVNRRALESASCECYQADIEDHRRLIA
jgi:hypothetical protein